MNGKYEIGKLPPIIAEKKVFKEMTNPERTKFYALVKSQLEKIEADILGDKERTKGSKILVSQDLYKQMLHYPEKRLNQAFLENKFKNEQKWLAYVSVFEFCLYEHLAVSLDNFQQQHQKYTTEIKVATKRIKQMQANLQRYKQDFLKV